jgi:hypothetical protein
VNREKVIDLDAIRARLAKATPGPWEANERGWTVVSEHANICALHDGQDSEFWKTQGRDSGQGQPNADLIAHAPTDLADLLALLDEARAALREIYEMGSLPTSSPRPTRCG